GGVAAGLALVVALVVVTLVVVTGALVVAAVMVTFAVVAAAVVGRARRGRGGHRVVVALDLRVGVDRALGVVAVEEVDGEDASRERGDLTRLLLAVLDAVVVGVGVARVVARHELGLVAQAVVVLVALGLVDLQAQ